VPHRAGREPTNTERHDTLETLSADWTELDAQLTAQLECCLEIQKTVSRMD